MSSRHKSREYALQVLCSYEYSKESNLKDIAELCEKNFNFKNFDELYFNQILENIEKNIDKIDKTISKYLRNWKLDRILSLDRNILRIAVYEIMFRDDIPDKVAINEALELTKKYSADESKNFINGILDSIVKEAKK